MFSWMHSKGSRFPLGFWGLRLCSPGVVQPSATVRNRPHEGRMALLWWVLQKWSLSGGSKRRVASFRLASVALCDIPTCFIARRKPFCVARAILLRRLQKMSFILRGRRSTLESCIVILRGRRNALDGSSGDNMQILWQAWRFVTCAENWRMPGTKRRFEVANFEVHENSGEKANFVATTW